MEPITSLLILTLASCLSVTGFSLLSVFRSTDSDSLQENSQPRRNLVPFLLFLATISYASLVIYSQYKNIQTDNPLQLSSGNAITLIGMLYLLVASFYQFFKSPVKNNSFVIIIAILCFLAGLSALGTLSNQSINNLDQSGTWLNLHIFLSLSAYSLVSIAFLFSLIQFWQAKQIKSLTGTTDALPSLFTLEKETFRWLSIGFVLLTFALLTGFYFLYDLRAQHLPHKVILSILSWCVFTSLLAGRHFLGWRGRQAHKMVLIGFVLLLLAYFGSKFVLEVLLERSWA